MFKGDPGTPGVKGSLGIRGEPVSVDKPRVICLMPNMQLRGHCGNFVWNLHNHKVRGTVNVSNQLRGVWKSDETLFWVIFDIQDDDCYKK